MTRVVTTYRNGVRTFDHATLARLPAYATLRQALSDLCNEIREATETGGEPPVTVDQVLADVRDMVLTAPFGDRCPWCKDRSFTAWPSDAIREGEFIRGTYRCDQGHTWKCSYAISIAGM